MYTEKIVDVITGEETIREYTKEEVAAVEQSQAEAADLAAKEAAKFIARLAILSKLGITEEEARLLLG